MPKTAFLTRHSTIFKSSAQNNSILSIIIYAELLLYTLDIFLVLLYIHIPKLTSNSHVYTLHFTKN